MTQSSNRPRGGPVAGAFPSEAAGLAAAGPPPGSGGPAAGLDARALADGLRRADPAGRWAVELVAQTGSTHDDLVQRARLARPEGHWLRIALAQTAGRGRQGRTWLARPGDALLLSLATPWPGAELPPPAVAPACGVAVAEALRHRGLPVQLKWPNDVLLDQGKLAGLLAEAVRDRARATSLVIGLGLNLVLPALDAAGAGPAGEALQSAAAPAWPAAALAQAVASRAELARLAADLAVALPLAMTRACMDLARTGFAPWRDRFDALFAQRGQQVSLHDGARVVARGMALGVDDTACLRVLTAAGEGRFNVGELSLRGDTPDATGDA